MSASQPTPEERARAEQTVLVALMLSSRLPTTEERARALHAWFCQSTGQNLPLRMDTLTAWMDWLMAGHNGPELARVIKYLRREISAGRRNPGALKLSLLLDIRRFEEDLGLADMQRAGAFDPDAKLAALPESERPASPTPSPKPAKAATTKPADAVSPEKAAEILKGFLR